MGHVLRVATVIQSAQTLAVANRRSTIDRKIDQPQK